MAIALFDLPQDFTEETIDTMRVALFETLYNIDKYRSPRPGMHFVSVREPWADLILSGEKLVENRDWKIYSNCEGRWVAIHASKHVEEEHCDPHKLEFYKKRAGHILGMCSFPLFRVNKCHLLFDILRFGPMEVSVSKHCS